MARSGKRKAPTPLSDAEFAVSDNDQDDFSQSEDEEHVPPPKRKRTVSEKQNLLNKDSELMEIQRLEKHIARLKRGAKKTSNEKAPHPDDDLESQDEDDLGLAAFQSQSKTSATIRTDARGNPSGQNIHRQNKNKSSRTSKVVYTPAIGKHQSAMKSASSSQAQKESSRSHSEPAPESPVKPIRQRRASSPPMEDFAGGMNMADDGSDVHELPHPIQQAVTGAAHRREQSATVEPTAPVPNKGASTAGSSTKSSEPPNGNQSSGPSNQNNKNSDSAKGSNSTTKNPHVLNAAIRMCGTAVPCAMHMLPFPIPRIPVLGLT